ncbi:MAG: metallophosphoesterase [Thermoplasmata archaeon]|nr:metallophosphoesterase [Thermoplasmata archaeon]
MAGRSFRFAHLADAHVGAWPREPAVRGALRTSVLRALEVVEERGCEFLLVSGDLFHTPVPEPAEVAPVAARLRRLVAAGCRVYVIYGSHDYVAHRVSWLDVLAESGLFLRAAPEPVRAEGDRWSLRFTVDGPTGAVIAGISGRSHGLDAAYFRSVDSEAFRAQPGFHIFQFHAAIREYLPPPLREHIEGISREDLPPGCAYYAGGHIHFTYEGSGPDGGLLVNPGAVFGTSITDLEHAARRETHQGVAIVTVTQGEPSVEFVDTAPTERITILDVDVDGKAPSEARALVSDRLAAARRPGALVFSRVHGTLAEGDPAAGGFGALAHAKEESSESVTLDLSDLVLTAAGGSAERRSEAELELEMVRRLSTEAPAELVELHGSAGEERIRQLLRELGWPRSEGQAALDYRQERTDAALALLRPPRARPVTPEA